MAEPTRSRNPNGRAGLEEKEPTFSLKVFNTDMGRIVAACDIDILGARFEENDKILYVKSDFYKGECVKFEKILRELEGAIIANFVGPELIKKLIAHKIVLDTEIKKVENIPHCQIYIL